MSHDQMVTDEAFAQDLQAAILASKVQYDVDAKQKEDFNAKKIAKKGAKMTLQEFNQLSIGKETNGRERTDSTNDTFFEDVEEATKIALNRSSLPLTNVVYNCPLGGQTNLFCFNLQDYKGLH